MFDTADFGCWRGLAQAKREAPYGSNRKIEATDATREEGLLKLERETDGLPQSILGATT